MDLVDVVVEVKALDRRIDDLEELLYGLADQLGYTKDWNIRFFKPILKEEEK